MEHVAIKKSTLWKGTAGILIVLVAIFVLKGGLGSGNGLESVTGMMASFQVNE